MEIKFPHPKDGDHIVNPLTTLENFSQEFNKIYDGHFMGVVITTSNMLSEETLVLNYSFWINFLKIEDYSYRMFEVIPEKPDGGFPVTVNAFQGPVEPIGSADSPKALEKLINKLLNSPRGRFIILSNY